MALYLSIYLSIYHARVAITLGWSVKLDHLCKINWSKINQLSPKVFTVSCTLQKGVPRFWQSEPMATGQADNERCALGDHHLEARSAGNSANLDSAHDGAQQMLAEKHCYASRRVI